MSKRPKGFFKGAEAEARTQGKAMSPGTSASGGTRHGGNGTKGTVSTGGNGIQKTSLVASTVNFITVIFSF